MPYTVNVWDDGLKETPDNIWEKIDDNGMGKIVLKNKSGDTISISEWKVNEFVWTRK